MYMEKSIREPKQQRSIEKKDKIIRAAYELFSEKGFYSTVTSDIAKRAGVSTGIVYGYFSDKRDILFYVLKIYIRETASPVMEYVNAMTKETPSREMFEHIIDMVESIHRKNANLHNILHSLAVVDEGINAEFLSLEKHITLSAAEKFTSLGYRAEHLEEKIHVAMNLIQSFAHEAIYDQHDYLDYAVMRREVVNMLVKLFE